MSIAKGDCCEHAGDCTIDPALVGPWSVEVLGNGVDDHCDPGTDDLTPASCCTNAKFGSVTPTDAAYAMELCDTGSATTGQPGLVSASWRRADGTTLPGAQTNTIQNSQTAVMYTFGTGGVAPTEGATMTGISTGWMRDTNDPGFPGAYVSTSFGYSSNPPASADGGNLPTLSSCIAGTCQPGTWAYDPVNLRLELRVPANAHCIRPACCPGALPWPRYRSTQRGLCTTRWAC